MLQGLDHSLFTIFSMDNNMDFLQSYAQVCCGEQQLSWRGTTIQAVQTLTDVPATATARNRISHDRSFTYSEVTS